MIRGIYTVRDEASGLYMTPTASITNEVAIRDFDYAVQSNDLMRYKPEDFSLWHIGDYDDATGVIDACNPQCIKRGTKRGARHG